MIASGNGEGPSGKPAAARLPYSAAGVLAWYDVLTRDYLKGETELAKFALAELLKPPAKPKRKMARR